MTYQKKVFLAAMFAGITALPTAAMAQAKGAATETGFYAGASVGQSMADCEVSGGSCDDKDTAYKIFAGWQFHPNFAVEGSYSPLGETTASFGVGNVTTEVNAWDLVGVGIFPLNPQFSLYGKLGFYSAEAKLGGLVSGKKTTTDLTYGFGAQWYFTRNLGLRGEWQRYSGVKSPDATGGGVTVSGESDIDVVSVGVVWKF